jgi:hypothetical protein
MRTAFYTFSTGVWGEFIISKWIYNQRIDLLQINPVQKTYQYD